MDEQPEMILVVDDEPQICAITSEMLHRLGYRTLQAYSATEALEIFNHKPNGIRIVLTDVVMPVMNGRELAERLYQMRPDLKVVFMSGYTGEVLRKCDNFVVNESVFLRKPFNSETLATMIRRLLDN